MSGTAAGAAAARAKRTRVKHDRWIAELSGAGWSVIQASHISLHASALMEPDLAAAAMKAGERPVAALHLWCERCDTEIVDHRDQMDVEVPLPRVLHAVSGHTCEGPRS